MDEDIVKTDDQMKALMYELEHELTLPVCTVEIEIGYLAELWNTSDNSST